MLDEKAKSLRHGLISKTVHDGREEASSALIYLSLKSGFALSPPTTNVFQPQVRDINPPSSTSQLYLKHRRLFGASSILAAAGASDSNLSVNVVP